MRFFQKTKGLAACIREQPCLIGWHTMAEQPGLVEWGMPRTGCVSFKKTKGLAACVRGQPCGIEQYTMTKDARLIEFLFENH